jgi:hypothetical protein
MRAVSIAKGGPTRKPGNMATRTGVAQHIHTGLCHVVTRQEMPNRKTAARHAGHVAGCTGRVSVKLRWEDHKGHKQKNNHQSNNSLNRT